MLVIEPEKCSGCKICELICSLNARKLANNHKSSTKSRIKIIKRQMKNVDMPIVCGQCENPLCIKVCPLEVLTKDPSSEVIKLNQDDCIGCRLCSYICPIDGIWIDAETGTAIKCEQCDGDPVCVKFCPSKAIKYLDYDKAVDTLKRTKTKKILELITPTTQ